MRVLLVDDECDFAQVLQKRLNKRGMDVQCVHNGPDALTSIAEDRPDVVVLDVKMPDMDGLETLRRIKEIAPALEVVLLSGHASVETAVQGMEQGAFSYLLKPVDLTELVGRLEQAVAHARATS